MSLLNFAVVGRLFPDGDKFHMVIASFRRRENRFDRYFCVAIYIFLLTSTYWISPYYPNLGFCKPIRNEELSNPHLAQVPDCRTESHIVLALPQFTQSGEEWLPVCVGNGEEVSAPGFIVPTTKSKWRILLTNGVLRNAQQVPYHGRVLYYFTGRFHWQYRWARILSYLWGVGGGGLVAVSPLRVLPLQLLLYSVFMMVAGFILWWEFTIIPDPELLLLWKEPHHPKLADLLMYTTDRGADTVQHASLQIKQFEVLHPTNPFRAWKNYWLQAGSCVKHNLLTKILKPFPEPIQDRLRHLFFGGVLDAIIQKIKLFLAQLFS